MASSIGSSMRHLILVILAVKQIALPGEAGKPFFGYGDEGGGGVTENQPWMRDLYEFQCNGWPVLSPGYPPAPYSGYGSVFNHAGPQQWVYFCVMSKVGAQPAYSRNYENYNPCQLTQQPPPRQIRSGPSYCPAGFPAFPDVFRQSAFSLSPPAELYERPWRELGSAMGAGEWGVGGFEAPVPPLKIPIIPAPIDNWEEEDYFDVDFPPFPKLQISPGSLPAPPSGYGGGGRRSTAETAASYFPSQNYQYFQNVQNAQNSQNTRYSQDVQNGQNAQNAEVVTRVSGLNSTAPIQFEPIPTDSPVISTTMATVARSYAPYTRYGLRLIQ